MSHRLVGNVLRSLTEGGLALGRRVRSNAVAIVALVFAMSGTAVATQLAKSGEAKPAAKGGNILRAIVHSSGLAATRSHAHRRLAEGVRLRVHPAGLGLGQELKLTGNTWTQYPNEVTETIGNGSTRFTPEVDCGQHVIAYVFIEDEAGEVVNTGQYWAGYNAGDTEVSTEPIEWEGGATAWQYPTSGAQTWKVSAEVVIHNELFEPEQGPMGLPCSPEPPQPSIELGVYALGAR
jgi:hypothetical protein